MTLAGTPPTTTPSATSFVTTAPAATITLGPIVTPGLTHTFAPIYTLSNISIFPNLVIYLSVFSS